MLLYITYYQFNHTDTNKWLLHATKLSLVANKTT